LISKRCGTFCLTGGNEFPGGVACANSLSVFFCKKMHASEDEGKFFSGKISALASLSAVPAMLQMPIFMEELGGSNFPRSAICCNFFAQVDVYIPNSANNNGLKVEY
jgi:hypothetical protein